MLSFNFFGNKSSYAAKDGILDTVVTIKKDKKERNSIRLNARKNYNKVLRVQWITVYDFAKHIDYNK